MKRILALELLFIVATLSSCYTPKKEKEVKDELFALKTRLADLEDSSNKTGKTVKDTEVSSRRTIASAQSELEKVNLELQRIKGELEALKVVATAGEMPGADPEADSVAKRIRDLTTRVEALEQQPATQTRAPVQPESKAGANIANKQVTVKEIRDAFNSKRFKFVIDNAANVIARLKTKITKEEISYFEAESLFRIGRMKEAALKFNDFEEQFAGSSRLAHAKMRMGDCFRQLGDSKTAKIYYKELVTKYPQSEEAKRSRKTLEDLEGQGASRYNGTARKKYTQKPRGREAARRS